MNKITCDICGTSYPETSDQCPICGCTRGAGADLLGSELAEEELTEQTLVKGAKTSKRREIFDFDEVNAEMEDEEVEDDEDDYDEDDDDEDEDEEEEGGHSTVAVILLTLLIIALLVVVGFLFVKFFLPSMSGKGDVPETTAAVEIAAPTTEAGVPCQSLVLTSGTAELSQAGQYFLLHVQAMPEDTTDVITFKSADESIATVTEDGKITAVAEGETIVYITCGNSQLNCPVVVKFVEEIEPPTEATAATEAVEETTAQDEEQPAEETTAAAESGLKNVELKLKKKDIGLGVYYQFTLELDCDLEPTEVEWKSEHPHIASVDENGVVKALKEGTTAIIAKYGDQTVQCIVRCHF